MGRVGSDVVGGGEVLDPPSSLSPRMTGRETDRRWLDVLLTIPTGGAADSRLRITGTMDLGGREGEGEWENRDLKLARIE